MALQKHSDGTYSVKELMDYAYAKGLAAIALTDHDTVSGLREADEYVKELPEFAFRLKVKAGLTGYAQIFGKYNTTSYDKLKLDMIYVENCSLLMDLKLLLLTLKVIFIKESTEGLEEGQITAMK